MSTAIARVDNRSASNGGAAKIALRRRLLGDPRSANAKLWGWLGPAIFTVVGGILRLWNVGRPHQLIFDETYYVKQGWSLVQYGFEKKLPGEMTGAQADSLFTMGSYHTVFGPSPDFIVHPPLGKWIIGVGELPFGITNSFGWRFGVALVGTQAIYLTGRAAWHLFRSAVLATIAALLMCFEGLEFVMSRTGILDIMVMFWALAAFVALLADRDRSRRILADKVAAMRADGRWSDAKLSGPWLGIRPWRIVAGICLGACIGTKISGLYFTAAFGLLTVMWDLGARRAAGVRHWIAATFIKDALQALVTVVGLACTTYVATWAGWLATSGGYDRNWAATNPAVKDSGFSPDSSLFAWMPDALRSLWQYNVEMYNSALSITSPHTYQSNPWTWMLQTRPTSFFYEGPTRGKSGCTVDTCSKAITSLGNVSIWWFGTAALIVLLFMWIGRRDWRAGAIWCGVAAGWLPWFLYQQRTVFTFYAVAFAPYVVLACVYLLGLILGSPTASASRQRKGRIVVASYVVLTVAVFCFFWPIWTAQVIPFSHWQWRMWFPSWI